ncbi:hypothetical protein [Micromonospora citrea]|uniref:hypothetical protein n=1 Tax=Micromonospora citrea TaxID=47855 RepID=UPI00114CA12C|nr:hypothetical protein [Micromonospora citrea]
MTDPTVPDDVDGAPTTALLESVLAQAAEVVIVEASPDELDRADAARTVVTGEDIAELARLLSVVDGGTGDRCRCPGWPTVLVSAAGGRRLALWTLHHQAALGGLGNCDAALRDGSALTRWLAGRGLTGSRDVQQSLARAAVEREDRRARWVAAAPRGLTAVAAATSRREAGAEERLVDLVARRHPDAVERVLALLAWAGFPPRQPDGTPWHELAPQRLLLAEPTELIFEALASVSPTPAQLDGAAELFTSLEWTRPPRAELPEPLRTVLIDHVTATGTDPMRFRMRHGYGAGRATGA